MNDNIIENWEDEIENELTILDEATNYTAKNTEGKFEVIYNHMAKYKYCSNNYQDKHWENTIRYNVKTFNDHKDKFTTNTINKLNRDSEKMFRKGVNQAEKEVKKYGQHILKNRIPSHPIDGELDWFNIEDIINIDKINNWLNDNRIDRWYD